MSVVWCMIVNQTYKIYFYLLILLRYLFVIVVVGSDDHIMVNIKNYFDIEQLFWVSLCQKHEVINSSVECYLTSIDLSIFNFILIRAPINLKTLHAAQEVFDEKNKAYCLVIKDSAISSLLPILTCGSYKADSMTTAMGLALNKYTKKNQWQEEKSLVIRLVNDNLSLWAQPLKSAFLGEEIDDLHIINQYIEYHQNILNKKIEIYHFVLIKSQFPVTSLTLTIHNKMARLDDIATHIDHQKQGNATYLIRYVLDLCLQKKITCCYLESSPYGVELYRRLGFEPLFNYFSYYKV